MQEAFGQNLKDYEDLWEKETHRALSSFLQDTLEGALRYPNLTKAHLSDVFNKSDYSGPTVSYFNEFMAKFYNLIKNILLQKDEKLGRIAAAQLFNSMLIAGMMPDLYESFWGFSIRNIEVQHMFIQLIIDNYCEKI